MSADKLTILALFIGFAVWEASRTGFVRKRGATRDDLKADAAAYLATGIVLVPLVFALSYALAAMVFPVREGQWSDWPLLAQFGVLLIADDLVQYAWHRAAHRYPLLYRLHRAHHEAGYMSVRVASRNNLLYYLLMPNYWLTGILIYFGFGWAFAIYLPVKMLVVYGAHSDVRWDAVLYRHRWLHPVAWVVERTISTPSTHFMHHGKHLADGITHYKGNYGNLLFVWDVLFGTARITRRYPDAFGTENLAPATWTAQIFAPWGVSARRMPSDGHEDSASPEGN